jgi:acyl-homoserine lactone acylase PvdQ
MKRFGWHGWLVAVAIACVMLAAAPAAGGGIIRATSVLPPGESGFVPVGGLLTGMGSPHLYDQQQPFIDFRRKDAMFSQPGAVQNPRPGVRIARDTFGVPSVTGASSSDLWWGAGWATAEDRLFELEIYRHTTTGTMAALLGPSYLPMDIEVRRDFYTEAQRVRMFGQLPRWMRVRY